MTNLLNKTKTEIFGGWSTGEMIYAWLLIGIQIAFYVLYPDSLWGFIAGVTGTICVLFTAKGKISSYFFGFIQTGIMMVLGFNVGLIGETGENVFYFFTQFLGIKEWKKNMGENQETVRTRKLTGKQWGLLIVALIITTLVLGFGFSSFNGTQPYIDAFTLAAALFGQMLMVYRFREQWLLWGLLNVVSIYQWVTLGNMSLVALYIAFLINTVYGFINWTKLQKPVNQENSANKAWTSN